VPIPIQYKSIKLDCGYRLDVLVNECLVLELKSVEKFLIIHETQMLTYLKHVITNEKEFFDG
jgi:GxxExxY protein